MSKPCKNTVNSFFEFLFLLQIIAALLSIILGALSDLYASNRHDRPLRI